MPFSNPSNQDFPLSSNTITFCTHTATMFFSRIAVVAAVAGLALAWEVPNKLVDMDITIKFSWCREHGMDETCDSTELYHAQCFNFDALDDYLNDNLESISVENGRCVIWEKNDCKGDHTGMIVGHDIFTNNLCPNYDWARKASSIKCCGGNPRAHWCANPGKRPKCTD